MTALASAPVVWITGLPASGKTTFARLTRTTLEAHGIAAAVLDGDELRASFGIEGHDEASRGRFYARLAELAASLARRGVVAIVAATAHRRAYRAIARAAAPRFVEVYVTTSLAECAARDPKGLYAQARAGAAPTLPGIGVPYEVPEAPDVIATGGLDRVAAGHVVARVMDDAGVAPAL